jgi:hypothetical protein
MEATLTVLIGQALLLTDMQEVIVLIVTNNTRALTVRSLTRKTEVLHGLSFSPIILAIKAQALIPSPITFVLIVM